MGEREGRGGRPVLRVRRGVVVRRSEPQTPSPKPNLFVAKPYRSIAKPYRSTAKPYRSTAKPHRSSPIALAMGSCRASIARPRCATGPRRLDASRARARARACLRPRTPPLPPPPTPLSYFRGGWGKQLRGVGVGGGGNLPAHPPTHPPNPAAAAAAAAAPPAQVEPICTDQASKELLWTASEAAVGHFPV